MQGVCMEHLGLGFPEVIALVGVLLYIGRKRLAESSSVLADIFRGGPRPPTHPIPGDDSRFLTRRRVKVE